MTDSSATSMSESARLIRKIVSQMNVTLDAKSVEQAGKILHALDDIDQAVKFYDEQSPTEKGR